MQLSTGDRVRILTTGDDRIDRFAGECGEIISIRLVHDYLLGIARRSMLQAKYYSVTVRTPLGDVTLNDNEVIAL